MFSTPTQTQEGVTLNNLTLTGVFGEAEASLGLSGQEWKTLPTRVQAKFSVMFLVVLAALILKMLAATFQGRTNLGVQLGILADFSGVLGLGKFAAWGVGRRRRSYFYMKNPLFIISPVGVQDYLSCHTWLIHRCS